MYERIKEELRDIFDYWGEETRDDDVMDLTQFRLRDYIDQEKTFKLYRYTSSNYHDIRNIETQCIYLSTNGSLNDAFEGLPESLDDLTYINMQSLNDLSYMTCFTETNDNILMWSHYAEQHAGCCVEYDLKRIDKGNDLINHLFPIIYSEERQSQRNLDSLRESHLILNTAVRRYEEYDGEEFLDDILPLFLTKGRAWEYEKEWRIVYTKKQMYDMDKAELYRRILSFKCISAVYLGYRIDPEKRKHILEICNRIATEEQPIKVYQANLHSKKYKIIFKQIQ